MSPPACAVSPMPFSSTRKTKAALAALNRLPPESGKAEASPSEKVTAQSACSSSQPNRELDGDAGMPLEGANGGLVMIEHTGGAVPLTKQPTSGGSSLLSSSSSSSSSKKATPTSSLHDVSTSKGVLDASGTTVATDKSSTDNLLGKLTIHEADTLSDENDCVSGAPGGVGAAAAAAAAASASSSLRRSPTSSPPTLKCKSSFRSSPKSPKMKKTVSFTQVHVQEYARTIGDHPDVVLGPPISIDWEPQNHQAHHVDDYESDREAKRKTTKIEMRIHPNTRNRMMLSAGVSKEEIKAATKTANRVSSQRKSTAASLEAPIIGMMEEMAQSAKRKIKRRSWRSGDVDRLMGRSSSNCSSSEKS